MDVERLSRRMDSRIVTILACLILLLSAAALAILPLSLAAGPITVIALAATAAVAFSGEVVLARARERGLEMFDRLRFSSTAAVALVAVLLIGPLAGFVIDVVTECGDLLPGRERTARLPRLANLASYGAAVLAAAGVMAACGHPVPDSSFGLGACPAIIAGGVAYLLANYAVTRGLVAVLAGGRPLWATVRRELVPALPAVVAMGVIAAATAVLIDAGGAAGLLPLIAAVALPQLTVAYLVGAPSLARVTEPVAARRLRTALCVELRLSSGGRRTVELATRLLARTAHTNTPAAANVALHVDVCRRRARQQAEYVAPLEAQVILVADAWAALTAVGTRALSHSEAIAELQAGDLAGDAPEALRTAARIAAGEQALATATASQPRQYRLPRVMRQRLLAAAPH